MSAALSTKTTGTAKLPSTAWVALRRIPYELLSFVRETPSLVFNFGYPLLMYVIFVGSGIVGQKLPEGFTFSQYFLPGMIATGILVATLQELGQRVVDERESSLLKRLRTTPTTAASYVAGKVGQVTAIVLVQNILLLAMACLGFDAELPQTPQKWGIYLMTLVLGIIVGSALGFALAMMLPSRRSAAGVITPTLLVLQFFSGVFFPFDALPSWMHTVADLFPLRWLASGMRAALYPDSMAQVEPGGSFFVLKGTVILLVWIVVSVAVALKWFRWVPHEQK